MSRCGGMVDTYDSKSCAFGRVGSSPTTGKEEVRLKQPGFFVSSGINITIPLTTNQRDFLYFMLVLVYFTSPLHDLIPLLHCGEGARG
jgi:hypothetical protein